MQQNKGSEVRGRRVRIPKTVKSDPAEVMAEVLARLVELEDRQDALVEALLDHKQVAMDAQALVYYIFSNLRDVSLIAESSGGSSREVMSTFFTSMTAALDKDQYNEILREVLPTPEFLAFSETYLRLVRGYMMTYGDGVPAPSQPIQDLDDTADIVDTLFSIVRSRGRRAPARANNEQD